MSENPWYAAINGQQSGPHTLADLRQLIASGSLDPNAAVWTDGMPDWLPARDVPQLADLAHPPQQVAVTPAPPQMYGQPQVVQYSIGGDFKKTSSAATSAMILGIVAAAATAGTCIPYAGAICLPVGFITAVLAIIFGFVGKAACNREPNRIDGRGRAIAGIVLGIVVLALWIISLLVLGTIIAACAAHDISGRGGR